MESEDPYTAAMVAFQNAVRSAYEAGLDSDFMESAVEDIGEEYDEAVIAEHSFSESERRLKKQPVNVEVPPGGKSIPMDTKSVTRRFPK